MSNTLYGERIDGSVLAAAVVDLILFVPDQILLSVAVVLDRFAELVGYPFGNGAAIVDYGLFH
jgi:hypothetical protein